MGHFSSRNSRNDKVRASFVLNANNLGQRVISGASFTFLGIALRIFITLGSMAILARLLMPSDFGYVAMAAVVTELAGLLGGFGFGNILIQRKKINRLYLDTVFWASACVGLLVGGGVFLFSYVAGWILREPLIGDLLKLMSLNFILGGLTCVHEAILVRLMRFRTEFWIQITVNGMRSIAAIGFALLNFGVWSLVLGGVFGSFIAVLLYAVAVPYKPRLKFHASLLKRSWRISASYLGNGFLYYLNMNFDLFLIGRTLGATSLGYYQTARSLTDEIRGRIAMPLQRILFPAFSALQSDYEKLQSSVIRAGRLLAAIIIPIGIGISAIAQELVPILYGPKWIAIIPLLSMFGISGAIRGATAISTSIFNSLNQVPLGFKYNVIGTALMVSLVGLATRFGIEAVAIAVMAASFFAVYTFKISLRLIGLKARHLLQILGIPLIAATGMWIGIYSTRSYLSQLLTDNKVLIMTTLIVFGVIIYVSLLLIFSKQYLYDFRSLLRRLANKR